MSNTSLIVYLHGFRSGPQSSKSQRMLAYLTERGLARHFWCEQLPISAQAAMALVEPVIESALTQGVMPTLVGSSLGGFYATWLAEKYDLKAAVINPAVLAPLTLSDYLGEQTMIYGGEKFLFTLEHVAQLQALEVQAITRPERYWLLAESGDEVLDYRHAVAKYPGARQTVLEGGDHSFTRYDDYLPEIVAFAGVAV